MKEMGQLRMEARSDDFSMNHANSGPLSGGSFCLQNIGSTSNVHELETRSGAVAMDALSQSWGVGKGRRAKKGLA